MVDRKNSSIVHSQGCLYIVATPIGNLDDLTPRAKQVLVSVDLIAAEDTRHSQRLLNHYQIQTPMTAYHDFNESDKAEKLLERLQRGESIALISDAGTPLISDPGFPLVRLLRDHGIQVIPIPGACAAIAALAASGIPSDRFIFEGFLPAKSSSRKKRLSELEEERRTLIFYESPHRIINMLEDLQSVFGSDRYVVIARELTKIHETIYGDKVSQLIEWMASDPNQKKGEFVVVVHGAIEASDDDERAINLEKMLVILMREMPLKKAVKIAVEITGERKNKIYERALELEKNKS